MSFYILIYFYGTVNKPLSTFGIDEAERINYSDELTNEKQYYLFLKNQFHELMTFSNNVNNLSYIY